MFDTFTPETQADDDRTHSETVADTGEEIPAEDSGADELDEADQVQGESADAEHEDAVASKESKTTRRKRSGADRGLIRRVAGKTIDLSRAPAEDVQLLSDLLGCKPEPVNLTVAVMSASRADVAVLSEIKDLAASTSAERAVAVLTMGRPRMRTLWQVLAALGALGVSMPTSDPKAAMAIAEADLSDALVARVESVAALSRKNW